jgi:ATP-dependent DNA ligase
VALDEAGRPSFNILQNYSSSKAPYVFDVLVVAGRNVMREPLAARRELLQEGILSKLAEPIRDSLALEAQPARSHPVGEGARTGRTSGEAPRQPI